MTECRQSTNPIVRILCKQTQMVLWRWVLSELEVSALQQVDAEEAHSMENRKKPRSLAPLIFFTSHYFPFSCCELHPEKLVRVHPLLAGRILFLSNTYRKEQENAGLLSRFSPCCSVHLVLVRISHAEKEGLTDGKINTEFPNKALFLFWTTNNCVIYFKFWGFLYLFTFGLFSLFVCLVWLDD